MAAVLSSGSAATEDSFDSRSPNSSPHDPYSTSEDSDYIPSDEDNSSEVKTLENFFEVIGSKQW